ncbi:inositol monophosphatase family protein [Actinomadura livida]|uniref:inositol-phosphate phosphatase n=1 Tax=Actinomadura livida TaxID=79909 RepID=A0A7W7IKY7_9ACTN|nr:MULTISPECIES: inositol monophosphatase family protein [Actinomadura]MBB4779021.1 myo-inositol-1(or 4)-monophosphatase [Actinomadura catellatispora]GGU01115.1 inositol monophosphatase [Actinomadura livida]
MTDAPTALLPVALRAAEIASDLVRTRVPGLLTAKGDRDMASEVDYAVERAVRDYLKERTPDIAILGEEEGISGDTAGDLMWAIDPVDGTANFVRNIPLCGFSLGLIERGRPVVGVIDLPFLGTRYHAAQHTGAYLEDRRIQASMTTDLKDAIVAIGDYAVGEGAEAKNRQRIALTERLAANVQRIRMLGSAAIDLAWVAEGKLDASITLSNKPWDTAAGVIIAREAGAMVIDKDGTDHTLKSAATIATTSTLANAFLDHISYCIFGVS